MVKKFSALFFVATLLLVGGCDNPIGEEMIPEETISEETLSEIPSRRSPVIDVFDQNQMNARRSVIFNLPAFITEDLVYIIADRTAHPRRGILGTDIAVFDHDFVYQQTLHVTDVDDVWIMSFEVTGDAIYYQIFASDWEEQEESLIYLYRYDIGESKSTLIAEAVENKLIVDDLIFHQQSQRGSLYTLDLTSLEREFILDLQTVEFFINRENETIIYIGESNNLYQADMTGENKELLVEGATTIWSFDGERILYAASNPREFWIFDLESNTSFLVGNNLLIDAGGMVEVGFIGDYIFVADGYFIDVFLPNDPADRRRLLDQDFIFFTVLSDHIIFTTRGFQMHIVDLEGNIERLRLSRD